MLAAYLLVLPLLRSAKLAEEVALRYPGLETEMLAAWLEPQGTGGTAAILGPQPTPPMEAGYAGLVLQRLTAHTRTVLGATDVCLLVRDEHPPHRLRTVAEQGIGAEAILEPPPQQHRKALIAMADGRPISVPTGPWSARGTLTATPLLWHGQVRGVLSAALRVPAAGTVSARQIHLLEDLGGVAGQALEHKCRSELTRGDVSTELRVLLQALRRKHADTRERGANVLSLTRIVGSQLELDGVAAYELELAAALHDLGMLRVPSSILDPPHPLSPPESEIVRMHPLWGFEMLAGMPGLESIAPLVRAHHERWDGLGYPDGLGGERIPLASRIIAACEELVTAATHRSSERRGQLRAVEEFVDGAGTKFDPRIVGVVHETLVSPRHTAAGCDERSGALMRCG